MKRKDAVPQQTQSLGYLLRASYEALQSRVYDRVRQAGFVDIRPTHSSVLRNLPESGARITELAKVAAMTKQSMSYLVENLTSLGYLEVVDDAHDRRAKLVRYTPAGIELIGTLLRESAKAEAECSAEIGRDAMRALRQHLAVIAKLR